MKRISIGMILLVLMLWLNNAEAYTVSTYPENFGVGLPITTEISIVLNVPISMTGVNFSISPSAPGSLNVAGNISAEECDVLSYKYNPTLSYKLTKCFRITFAPTTYLQPGTLYTAEIRDGEFGPPFVWSFTTGTMSVSEEYVIQTQKASYTRPATGICPQGAVLVWQEKGVGILAQLFSQEQPFGEVILIAGPSFYSPNIGPDVAMDNNCNWLVGYQNDYPRTKETTLTYLVKRYDFDGNMLPSPQPILHYLPPDVVAHLHDFYPMQRDIGGIRVATSPSGRYFAAVYQVAKCFKQCGDGSDSYWYGGSGPVCKVAEYKCDNYLMGNIYSSDNVPTVLGDNKRTQAGGNILAPFAIKIINDIPFLDRDYNAIDLGGGCGGDCAYHPELCMSESILGVTWPELKGTNGGYPELANFDDIQMLAAEVPTGRSLTSEKRVSMLQGTRYDQWSSSCAASDSGYLTFTFVGRYLTNIPSAKRALWETDVYARTMYRGKWLTKKEFLVNDRSNRAREQYAPSVSMDDATKKIRFFWLANGTGGASVHTKQFSYEGLALTSEARLNPYNHFRLNLEMEKKRTTADMAHRVWSYNIGIDCKWGKCFIAYPIPDVMRIITDSGYNGMASYGDGNSFGYIWLWE